MTSEDVRFVGGLKTWECSYDLVDYLKTIRENYSSVTRVLEVNSNGIRCDGFRIVR